MLNNVSPFFRQEVMDANNARKYRKLARRLPSSTKLFPSIHPSYLSVSDFVYYNKMAGTLI